MPILQTIVFDKSQSLCIFAEKGSFCYRKCDYFWTKVAEFRTKVGTFLKKRPLFFHPVVLARHGLLPLYSEPLHIDWDNALA